MSNENEFNLALKYGFEEGNVLFFSPLATGYEIQSLLLRNVGVVFDSIPQVQVRSMNC